MSNHTLTTQVLDHEARSLMTRLARVKPFALLEPMLPAAAVAPLAQSAIERYLADGRRELRGRIRHFREWLQSDEGRAASPEEAHRKFMLLRMRFNTVLSQFDLFADVITQRSEHESGVWLAGLDAAASDALALPGYYESPPLICYLDRGPGAAIRRARTRMPGGTENPTAIVRVPRERMVGTGIASSLVHEVGHQAAALLGLVESLRPVLKGMQSGAGPHRPAWELWERWVSEIVADFWSVARVGVASTIGLMAVVSMPRAFVFRLNLDDPHPTPWVRVRLSCAMGQALYPHPQWGLLAKLWESFYPLDDVSPQTRQLLGTLNASMPAFVSLLINHRPKPLRGKSLVEVLATHERQPARLSAYFKAWRGSPLMMRASPPSLAFAVLGQARVDGRLGPEEEGRMLTYLLTYWALQSAMKGSGRCAGAHDAGASPSGRPRLSVTTSR